MSWKGILTFFKWPAIVLIVLSSAVISQVIFGLYALSAQLGDEREMIKDILLFATGYAGILGFISLIAKGLCAAVLHTFHLSWRHLAYFALLPYVGVALWFVMIMIVFLMD